MGYVEPHDGYLGEHIVGGPAAPYEKYLKFRIGCNSPGGPDHGLPKRAHIGRPQGALARHAE